MIVVSRRLKEEARRMMYGFVIIDSDTVTLELCRDDSDGIMKFQLYDVGGGIIVDYGDGRTYKNKAKYVRVYIPRYCQYSLVGVLALCKVNDVLLFEVRLRNDCESYKEKGVMHNELLLSVKRKGILVAQDIVIYEEVVDVTHDGDFNLNRR